MLSSLQRYVYFKFYAVIFVLYRSINPCSLWQAFNVTQGKENLRAFVDTNTASGVPINRWFCAGCGANIYMQSTNANRGRAIVVQSGGIDGNAVSEWGELPFVASRNTVGG